MGKTKKNSEVFDLKKELRECHETISTLEKQLQRFQKEKLDGNDSKEEKKIAKQLQKELQNKEKKCPDCDAGDVITSDLGIRIIKSCSKKCGFRKITKNEKT